MTFSSGLEVPKQTARRDLIPAKKEAGAAASPIPRTVSPSRGPPSKLAKGRPAPPAAEVVPTVSVTLERFVVRGGVPRAHPPDKAPAMEQRISFFYVFCSFVPLALVGMLLEAAVFVFSAVLQV